MNSSRRFSSRRMDSIKDHIVGKKASLGKLILGAVLAISLIPSYAQAHSDWETVAVGAVVGAVLIDALYEHEQNHKRRGHEYSYPKHHVGDSRLIPVHKVHTYYGKKHHKRNYHKRKHYKKYHHKDYYGYKPHRHTKTKVYYSGHHQDHRHCPPKRHNKSKLRVHF